MSLWSCIAKIFIHIKPKHLNNALGGPKLLSIVSKGYTPGLIYVGGMEMGSARWAPGQTSSQALSRSGLVWI